MIDVILPVRNEAEALPIVLEAFPAGFRPLVVDNGSTDDSAAIARRLGARTIHEPVPGFGAACFAGLTAATTDVVCFMDCDGSLNPQDLPLVADPVTHGAADLALGARVPISADAWPWHARLANRALAFELSRRARRAGTRTTLTDIGPTRAAPRTALLELRLRDRRFGWPLEMVLTASAQRWRITETPVAYRPRQGGESKVSGSLTGTLKAIRDMSALLVTAGGS